MANITKIPNHYFLSEKFTEKDILEPVFDEPYLFNTLGQLSHSEKSGKKAGLIRDEKQAEKLKKRANAKYITKHIVKALSELESPLQKSYINSLSCASILQQDNDVITSRYCGQRWCLVCNRIRTAQLINGYEAQLSPLEDKQFLTISRPNITADNLAGEIDYYQQKWRKIYKILKDKNRTWKRKIAGIKKLEVTYNDETDTYHPHYHIILSNEAVAEYALQLWLEHNPTASTLANKLFPVYSEKAYIEIFKYFTKFWSGKKIQHTAKYYADANYKLRKGIGNIYINSLDVIFKAMRNRRTFEAFGIVKQKSEKIVKVESEQFDISHNTDTFIWQNCDWHNTYNYTLSGYTPTPTAQYLIEKIVY